MLGSHVFEGYDKVFKSRAKANRSTALSKYRVLPKIPTMVWSDKQPFREESADGENEGFDHVFHSAVFRRERQSH